MQIIVADSPLIKHELTSLRDKNTDSITFRKGLVKIGRYLSYELTKSFGMEEKNIETPLSDTKGLILKNLDRILVINVLRAAIPLTEGILKVFPNAKVGIVSAYRKAPPYFEVIVDYAKIPRIKPEEIVIIADPMLATGSTMIKILKEVSKRGKARRTIILSVLSTSTALEKLRKINSELEVYTCSIDPVLNERGYIVPGLGDAGDRAFRNE